MKHTSDDNVPNLSTADVSRRRMLQALGAVSVAGLPGMASAQATAQVNTTKLAVTDTEVTVGQLHSSTGTMRPTRTEQPRLATPQEKSCMEDVSCLPVRRRSLPWRSSVRQ